MLWRSLLGKRSLHKGTTLVCVCVLLMCIVFFMTLKTFVVGMFDIVEIVKRGCLVFALKCFCISECRLF